MTIYAQAQEALVRVLLQALDDNWEEITPLFKGMALEILNNKKSWQITQPIQDAVDTALTQAIKKHTEDTFAPVVDAIAKEKARQQLAKSLKARGMDTSLLDSIP